MTIRKNTNVLGAIITGKHLLEQKFVGNWCIQIHLLCSMYRFSCSFECFKKHKDVECASTKADASENKRTEDVKRTILLFTTEDTVDPEKLAQLSMTIRQIECVYVWMIFKIVTLIFIFVHFK